MREYQRSHPRYFRARDGISSTVRRALFETNDGTCDSCKRVSLKTLRVDHDHITGKIRGLLCNSCNVGLGCFEDSIEYLESAIEYLKSRS